MERAAGVAKPSGCRLRSALGASSHHLLKRAWADEEDEPETICTLAETWSSRKGQMKVGFDDKVAVHYVPAYAEIYGQHPRTFVFAHDGSKIPVAYPQPPEKNTKFPAEHSLSLCEFEPPFTDSTHRRSMNASSIDLHVSLDDTSDVADRCPAIWPVVDLSDSADRCPAIWPVVDPSDSADCRPAIWRMCMRYMLKEIVFIFVFVMLRLKPRLPGASHFLMQIVVPTAVEQKL